MASKKSPKSLKPSRQPRKKKPSKPLEAFIEPPPPLEYPFLLSDSLDPKKLLKPQKLFKLLKLVSVIIIGFTVVLFWLQNYHYFLGGGSEFLKQCRGKNIAVINVHGDIVTYGDMDSSGRHLASSSKIVAYLNEADKDKKIKAIILDIDSFGGSPVAAEEVANTLKKIRKPTIAVIRGAGDSAAYMLATGAQKIYAGRFSEVGSIGITMSYLDYSQQIVSEGIIYQEISSGVFKDVGSPYRALTQEERDMLLEFAQELKEVFIEIVSVNRNLDILKVREMADGSVMTARDAKIRGLIDEIGNIEDVKDFLRNELNVEPKVCVLGV